MTGVQTCALPISLGECLTLLYTLIPYAMLCEIDEFYLQNVCRFHWILLDIQVDKSKVEVLDTLNRDIEQFSSMQNMLPR